MVSVTTTHLCCSSKKEAMLNTDCTRIPIKLHFEKEAFGYSLPTPTIEENEDALPQNIPSFNKY